MASIFPHRYKDSVENVNMYIPAVYKLWFGKKFIIWKGKTLHGSIPQNFADVSKMLLRSIDPNHAFSEAISYVRRARPNQAIVEIITTTTDPNLLLQVESDHLAACQSDPDCLNKNFEPHKPKWLLQMLEESLEEPQKKAVEKRSTKKVTTDQALPKVSPGATKPASGKVNALVASYKKLNG